MKTKYWIALLMLIVLVCAGLSLPLLSGGDAARAEIISEGRVIHTVDLRIDRQIRVTTSSGGENIITIQNGKIGVTEASCPDHYCVGRGMCSGGTQIVCLPNRLVIRFLGQQTADTVAG